MFKFTKKLNQIAPMAISAAVLLCMSAAVYGLEGEYEPDPDDPFYGYDDDPFDNTTTSSFTHTVIIVTTTPPETEPTNVTTTTPPLLSTETDPPEETEDTTSEEGDNTTPEQSDNTTPEESDNTTPGESETQPAVTEPPEISLSFGERWLTVGDGVQLTAQVLNTTEYSPVIFSSSNTGVVVVDASGYIFAAGAGSATVTVSSGDLRAYAYIYVREPEIVPEFIVLTENSFILKIGQTARIQARLLPEEAAEGYAITYESNDPSIAAVDANGVITAVSAGETDIVVAGAGLYEYVHVTVSTDIAYDTAVMNGYLYDSKGKPMAGTYLTIDGLMTVTDKNGYFVFDRVEQRSVTVRLAEDNDAACGLTVSGDLTVYLLYSPGVLTRVGSYEELAGLLAINSVNFISNSVVLTAGEVYELAYQYEPSDANITGISYSSSNTVAAAVGQVDGVITAKSPGEAVITLILNNGQATAECTVTVNPRESSEHSVLIMVIEAAVFAVCAAAVLLSYRSYKRKRLSTLEDEEEEEDTHDIF